MKTQEIKNVFLFTSGSSIINGVILYTSDICNKIMTFYKDFPKNENFCRSIPKLQFIYSSIISVSYASGFLGTFEFFPKSSFINYLTGPRYLKDYSTAESIVNKIRLISAIVIGSIFAYSTTFVLKSLKNIEISDKSIIFITMTVNIASLFCLYVLRKKNAP